MQLDFHSETFSWIRGGLFVLFLYHLLIYFQNKSKLYLYYSLYLLAITVNLLHNIISVDSHIIHHYLNFTVQFLAFAAYVAFSRELLDTRTHILKWDKYFEIEIKILLGLAPMFALIQVFLGYEFQVRAFSIIAPILTIFTLYSFYIIITRIRDKFSLYFVIGSVLYLLLANISFIDILWGINLVGKSGFSPLFFVFFGAILQCIIFSVIVGQIIKKVEQKSKNAEVRLANKLKEMEELKMTALQSQMNPHFVFNSLNSINNFVLKNEGEKASDYITKFSKLIRVILNSSSSPTSTLSEELGILSLYVKLEQMRVSGGFDYVVKVDPKLNIDGIKVPTLFLQPFIENAIWHGIMKKEGHKYIEVNIKEKNGYVLCEIKDNGIGIKKAKEMAYMTQKKKFYGTDATTNRIKLLYQNDAVKVNAKDISKDKETGTLVSITFPKE